MALIRYLKATVLLLVGILVFPWFFTTKGYTLEDRLQLEQLIIESLVGTMKFSYDFLFN